MKYVGITCIVLMGVLLHFLYEFSKENKIVGIFAAVNESVWEHIKIGMTATLIWGIYDLVNYGTNINYLFSKSISLLIIILLIPFLFYLYIVFTKKSILIIDIICFIITMTLSQDVFYYLLDIDLPNITKYIGIFLLIIEFIMYFTFTYKVPKSFLFKDPITKKYGIEGHSDIHKHD